ncbi:MAG: helix-turn-helix transcriptional regulator [Rickettsiales bacterium]|nr:helix-turn-helix transcriptional regulator [Rickettsiales bacterium]
MTQKQNKTDNSNNSNISSNQNEQAFADLSIGQILREKRQKLKITIADAALYLKIKSRTIEAVENDDLAKIIKQLYVPGLLRSYAKFLKVDLRIIEEKIKLLHIEPNTNNKNHQLLNIGENIDLTPDKDVFLNFLIVTILLFFTLLAIYNFSENRTVLISSESLVEELKKIDL